MENPLGVLMAALQGGPFSMLPRERQGVRPGFGLGGSQLKASDLRDKIRQPDNWKFGEMPGSPSGMLDDFMRVAASKGLTQDQAIKGAMVVMEDPDYYARVGYNGLIDSLRPKSSFTGPSGLSLDPKKLFESKF